jgi:DNA repair exonuclease SbcCD ATPase subunit
LQAKLEQSDVTSLKTRVIELQTEIDQFKNQCKEHQTKIEQQARLKDQLQELEVKIKEVESKLQGLEGNQADQIRVEIGVKQQEWIEVQRGIGLVKEQQELTAKREQLMIEQARLSALEDLKQRAIVLQYKRLQDTINSINAAMNKIFGAVFDDDIEVELKLFKLVKANKEHKPQVNCEIRYKGMTYERPNELSGGEQNRLNLGMILALNLVSTSPVVLLDECIHFLNDRLKTRCVEAVRAIVNKGKTIIAISHDDNEANYDEIIRVKMDGEFDAEVDSPRMEIMM